MIYLYLIFFIVHLHKNRVEQKLLNEIQSMNDLLIIELMDAKRQKAIYEDAIIQIINSNFSKENVSEVLKIVKETDLEIALSEVLIEWQIVELGNDEIT